MHYDIAVHMHPISTSGRCTLRQIPPLWISLLLFCLPVLASLPLSQLLGKPLARHMLQQKREEIEAALVERHLALDESISTQLAQFAFDCGPEDMALLRVPRFYNPHIRLQGLILASGASCSSLGLPVPFTTTALPPYSGQEQYGVAATPAQFNTEQELIAYLPTEWQYRLLGAEQQLEPYDTTNPLCRLFLP